MLCTSSVLLQVKTEYQGEISQTSITKREDNTTDAGWSIGPKMSCCFHFLLTLPSSSPLATSPSTHPSLLEAASACPLLLLETCRWNYPHQQSLVKLSFAIQYAISF